MPRVRPLLQRSRVTQKNGFISKIEQDHNFVKIKGPTAKVKINEVLPFRVKFINAGIPTYNVPPIGIAIIGYNNYILWYNL